MYLQSIARAAPSTVLSQSDTWEILQASRAIHTLRPASRSLLEKVLTGDSGIDRRHFAVEPIERVFDLDAQALNQAFEREAPKLAEAALSSALEGAGLRAEDLDALFVCTCTGYLCPGLSSYVGEHLGLPRHSYLQDIVGLGCGAAIPTLRAADGFLAANPEAKVACVAVEVCSAAFYLDNDPGVLISACLFGDGASASIWSRDASHTGYGIQSFDTVHQPENREYLRFVNSGGKLRNQLHRSVPEKAAHAVAHLHARAGLNGSASIAAHTGGRDVLDALEARLDCPPLSASRQVLRDYGNTSSPSVLFVLEDLLDQTDPPDDLWITSFGAGFAAHSCRLTRATS